MRKVLFCLSIILLFSSCEKGMLNLEQSYNSNWKFHPNTLEDTLLLELPMTFMDTWYTNQKIDDLHFDDNAVAIYIDFEKTWILETEVQINEEQLRYASAILNLDQLDGNCTIYLNGQEIGSVQDGEPLYEIEIGAKLILGNNSIRLDFDPLFKEGEKVFTNQFQHLFRKGNDFSPAHRNAGLENISISFTNNIYIKGHFLEVISGNMDAPNFQLIVDYNNPNFEPVEVGLSIPKLGIQEEIDRSSVDSSEFVSFSFSVNKEALWYPTSLGDAKMFDAILSIKNSNGLLEEKEIQLGFIDHQWGKAKDGYHYLVNNRPCKVTAIELSPAGIYKPNGDKNYWRKQLYDIKELGINCIKLSSDNFYAPESLLELCDSIGILVWQDFVFERPALSKDIMDEFKLRNELTRAIIHFREHPCVIALGISNFDNSSLEKLADLSSEEKTKLLKKDIAFFEYLAPKLTESGSGLKFFANAESFWNMDEQMRTPSLPEFTYLDLWMSEMAKDPEGITFKVHSPKGVALTGLYDSIMQHYTKPIDLEALIYFSELYQEKKLEQYMHSKRGENLHLLPLTYNELWPSVSPSVQSFYGTKKAVYYQLKRNIQEYVFEVEQDKSILSVSMKNNSKRLVNGKVEIELFELSGNTLDIDRFPLQLSSGNSGQVFFKDYTESLNNRIAKVKYLEGDSLVYEETHDFISFSNPNLPLPSPAFRVIEKKNQSYLEIFSETYMKTVKLSANHLGYFEKNYFNLLPGDTLRIPFISEDLSYPLRVEEVNVYSYYQSYE